MFSVLKLISSEKMSNNFRFYGATNVKGERSDSSTNCGKISALKLASSSSLLSSTSTLWRAAYRPKDDVVVDEEKKTRGFTVPQRDDNDDVDLRYLRYACLRYNKSLISGLLLCFQRNLRQLNYLGCSSLLYYMNMRDAVNGEITSDLIFYIRATPNITLLYVILQVLILDLKYFYSIFRYNIVVWHFFIALRL